MIESSQVENCNGFRFCKDCSGLCTPVCASSEVNTMIFFCNNCGNRRYVIDPTKEKERIIKKTQVLQSEVADIKHRSLCEDPSMPRKLCFCRSCFKDEIAVYYYKAGQEEKNIVTQFICKECFFSWTTDDLMEWQISGKLHSPLEAGKFTKNDDDEYYDDDDNDEEEENEDNHDLDQSMDEIFGEDNDIGRDDSSSRNDMNGSGDEDQANEAGGTNDRDDDDMSIFDD